jgi:hypothetical protein
MGANQNDVPRAFIAAGRIRPASIPSVLRSDLGAPDG